MGKGELKLQKKLSLLKTDKPTFEKQLLLDNIIREHEIVGLLKKELLLQRTQHRSEIRELKKVCNQNYVSGSSAVDSGWRKELEALTRRHMEQTDEQKNMNQGLEDERDKALTDAQVLEMKNDREKRKGRWWRTKCSENTKRENLLGMALGKTAMALAEAAAAAVAVGNADAANAAAIAAIDAAADSITNTTESIFVAISTHRIAYDAKTTAAAIKAAAAAAEAEAAKIEITAAIVAQVAADVARANAIKATDAKSIIRFTQKRTY